MLCKAQKILARLANFHQLYDHIKNWHAVEKGLILGKCTQQTLTNMWVRQALTWIFLHCGAINKTQLVFLYKAHISCSTTKLVSFPLPRLPPSLAKNTVHFFCLQCQVRWIFCRPSIIFKLGMKYNGMTHRLSCKLSNPQRRERLSRIQVSDRYN